jgi:hypothetical protein
MLEAGPARMVRDAMAGSATLFNARPVHDPQQIQEL